jgi:Short C-terminal domain
MGRKAVFGKCKALYGRTILAAVLALIISGCGANLLGGKDPEISSVIWKHRDQFVRIESQDRATTPSPANDHPASLSTEQVRNMLGSLDVQFEGEEKPIPVFTFKELEILGETISSGLAQAGPGEDVTFAIAGIHRGLVSFATDRSISTYRAFVENSQFNLIIGTLHEPYVENIERRMYPLIPGSRKYTPPNPRKRITNWQIMPEAGLELKTIDGRERQDWLVLNTNPELWKSAMAEKKEAKETAKEAFREASEVREESAQLEVEQQRMRSELQEMKQTIEQMKQAPAASSSAPVAAPAPAAPAGLDKIEQRLQILQQLKAKGLINDQEFRAKKQEILDSI